MLDLTTSPNTADQFSPSAILQSLDRTPQFAVSDKPVLSETTVAGRIAQIRAERGVENRGSCNWSGWGN